jgi:hypothetical protein
MSSSAAEHRDHAPAVFIVAVALLAVLGGGVAHRGAADWPGGAATGGGSGGLSLGGIERPYLAAPALCRVQAADPGTGTGSPLGMIRAAYPKMKLSAVSRPPASRGNTGWILLCPALNRVAQ